MELGSLIFFGGGFLQKLGFQSSGFLFKFGNQGGVFGFPLLINSLYLDGILLFLLLTIFCSCCCFDSLAARRERQTSSRMSVFVAVVGTSYVVVPSYVHGKSVDGRR